MVRFQQDGLLGPVSGHGHQAASACRRAVHVGRAPVRRCGAGGPTPSRRLCAVGGHRGAADLSGQPCAAIAPYEQALRLRLRLALEMRVEIVTTLADACVQVNAFAKAVRYAQEGLRLRPGDPQLTRILAAATRGRR